MKEYLDISWPISNEITTYKDKKDVKVLQVKSFEKDNVNESKIELGNHTGTHIDAPLHFTKDGDSINKLDLRLVNGRCKVLDFTKVKEKITSKDLESKKIEKGDIILLKTTNSSLESEGRFEPNFVYLEKSGAEFLIRIGVKCVGIDYLGIERSQPEHETHVTLFKAGICIIEGLRLNKADEDNEYYLHCMPLLITNVEAAPARAILVKV